MSFSPKLVCLFLVVLLPATLYAQKKKDIPQGYGEIKVGDLTLDGIAERYNRMFRDSFGTPPVTITRFIARFSPRIPYSRPGFPPKLKPPLQRGSLPGLAR